MRLFVAVDFDEQVRRAAARVTRTLRDRLERAETYGVSWVAPENFHLTLRFLGEVSDETARLVAAAIEPAFSIPPFEIELGGVGVFPPAGSVRVVWLGVPTGGADLAQLHAEVERRLAPLQFAAEDRPYRAHLTVGRFRAPAPARIRDAITGSAAAPIGRCTIRHVTLYRSQLSPKGAIYTSLVSAPLAATTMP